MPHIFISYSKRHRDLTEQLVADLKDAGWADEQIWWDDRLESGEPYPREIARALDTAAAVVVLWTEGAVQSDWVYAEANRARVRRRLVQAVDDALAEELPMPFDALHIEPLSARERLIRAIERRAHGEELSEPASRVRDRLVLDDKRQPLQGHRAARAPSALLQARHQVAPFIDLAGRKQALIDWATNGEPLAGLLLHAPGGYGKTRLLIEVLAELERESGWLTGFVPAEVRRHDARERQLSRLITGGRDAPGLLLVVDYAEGRQDDIVWLCERLLEREADAGPPARLVLLTRSAGEWWDRLQSDHDVVPQVFALDVLRLDTQSLETALTPEQRRELYDHSRDAFAGFLGDALTQDAMPAPETEHLGDRPLAIHMRALLDLTAATAGDSVDKLLDSILGLEREYWKTRHVTDAQVIELARGATQVTLALGIPDRDAGRSLLAGDTYFDNRTAPARLDPVLDDLLHLYGGAEQFLMPVEPDLIGEHLVATTADELLLDATLAWADGSPERIRAVLTTLNRASRAEHGPKSSAHADLLLRRLVRSRAAAADWARLIIEVAIDTSGELPNVLTELAREGALTVDQFEVIATNLPLQTESLAQTVLAVTGAFADSARDATRNADADPERQRARLAFAMTCLGIAETNAGQPEAALKATREAVLIRRELAASRPDAYRSGLAGSLNNLGGRLSSLGDTEAALKAAQEAVAIYRDLEAARPDAYQPDLAISLHNLGVYLSSVGDPEAALEAAEEALAIRRELAVARPDAYQPDLARSLVNMGSCLLSLGDPEAARDATKEAVAIYRDLAAARPDAYQRDLAMSLVNMGSCLLSLGDTEVALDVTQESVAIYRDLAAVRPDAYQPDLARSLDNLGVFLSLLGDPEAAREAAQEAVAIYRDLAASRPDAYRPDLARSLNNLGGDLSSLGDTEAALKAAQEAVAIYRDLEAARPDAYRSDLAGSLSNLGIWHSNIGHPKEALEATQEAVLLFRVLRAFRPEKNNDRLASALENKACAYLCDGQSANAAHSAHAALMLLRPLMGARPKVHSEAAREMLSTYREAVGQAGLEEDAELTQAIEAALVSKDD